MQVDIIDLVKTERWLKSLKTTRKCFYHKANVFIFSHQAYEPKIIWNRLTFIGQLYHLFTPHEMKSLYSKQNKYFQVFYVYGVTMFTRVYHIVPSFVTFAIFVILICLFIFISIHFRLGVITECEAISSQPIGELPIARFITREASYFSIMFSFNFDLPSIFKSNNCASNGITIPLRA